MYIKYLILLFVTGTHLWSKAETLLLINTYSDYKDEFHSGKCTVKQSWGKIAKIMQDKGYNVSGVKCSTKFQALKRTYKTILDHNSRSGNNPKKWEYFQVLLIFKFLFYVKTYACSYIHVLCTYIYTGCLYIRARGV